MLGQPPDTAPAAAASASTGQILTAYKPGSGGSTSQGVGDNQPHLPRKGTEPEAVPRLLPCCGLPSGHDVDTQHGSGVAVVLRSDYRQSPVPLTSNPPLSSPGGYSSQSNYNSPGSGQNYSGPPSSYQSSQGGYGRNADHSMNYQYR